MALAVRAPSPFLLSPLGGSELLRADPDLEDRLWSTPSGRRWVTPLQPFWPVFTTWWLFCIFSFHLPCDDSLCRPVYVERLSLTWRSPLRFAMLRGASSLASSLATPWRHLGCHRPHTMTSLARLFTRHVRLGKLGIRTAGGVCLQYIMNFYVRFFFWILTVLGEFLQDSHYSTWYPPNIDHRSRDSSDCSQITDFWRFLMVTCSSSCSDRKNILILEIIATSACDSCDSMFSCSELLSLLPEPKHRVGQPIAARCPHRRRH